MRDIGAFFYYGKNPISISAEKQSPQEGIFGFHKYISRLLAISALIIITQIKAMTKSVMVY
jgi:hypothetical protein